MESKRSFSHCAAMLLASAFLTGALPAFAGERSDAFVAAARRAYAADPMCRTTIVTNFAVKGKPDDKTSGLVRWYDVEGARNVRDIGGWTGLRAGRVFRGTELNSKPNHKQYELTERGRAVMRGEMGIVSDLDLRGEIAEYGEDAKTKSPIGEGVQLLSRPVSSYVETCASPHSAKAFANALRVFADEKNFPVYVHCAGGADRTGTVCFLLETLCGASLEDATIEYELTSFSPVGVRRRDSETGLPFALMVRLLSSFPGETFNDKVAYWAENIAGLTKDEIARIRANLRMPVASPWDEVVEKGAPIAHEAEGFTGKAKAVFLDGEDWRGRQTRFFAWYGVPESASATNKCPAVVLVHGGAGTAFDWWVRMWNERGYAAIAMDTCGAVLRKESDGGKSWMRHDWSGPAGWGGFGQIDEPERDQWTYHAVADVILSHSFLRALPEVDVERIGITGISWGGYLTCIAASVDHRFAWAASVYGCGFYANGSAWAKELSDMGARGEKWLRTWDAGNFLPRAECPFLFVSGTTDRFFKVPMLKKSAAALKGPVFFDIREMMPHSQQAGATPESVRSFADHWFFGKPLSPDISNKWMVKNTAFASVEAARDAARTMQKPAVVHLAPGVHRLEKPLVLGPEDSGVTYVADGNVVISGARPVTDWRVEADGTWSAPVPWVRSDRTGGFRSLRVNGAMRPRARLPKEGHFTVVNDDLPEGTRYNVPRPSFFYDPKEFNPEWANLGDAEIVCFHFWTDSHLRIASVDVVSNKVTFVTPSGKAFDTGWSNNKAGGLRGIYTIENLPAAMTEPGEWWLEYGAARVHYRPMPGETPETVKAEVPFCPELVVIEGTPEKGGRYIEDVVFRGIRFELSQFELKSVDVNNAQGAATVSAAVRLVGARRCRFEDCVFVNLGGYVADILKGSRDNAFSRCTMTRLGAGGVRLDGGKAGCPPVELTSGNAITDCEIGPYGLDFRSAVGVLLKNAERTSIAHNHIHDGYYTGVSAGWVWGYYPSVCRENEISHNHIHDIGKGLLSDMGGIYTLGPSYGMRIANNRIHDVDASRYGGWGIYHDEGTVGALVENNVVYDTKFAPFNIHYAKDVTVRNNIFAFGRSETISRGRREPHVSCELLNNIFYWTEGNLYSGNWSDAETPFPVHRRGNKLEANKAGSTVTFNADRNVYFNPALSIDKIAFGDGKSLEDWRKMGKDLQSVYADPLFHDAAARDFRLLPDSPAFRLGFVDFDQCDIGPKPQR